MTHAVGEKVRLRDGSVVWIRPIAAGDKALLRRVLERLSPESRYRRFFSPKGELTPRELTVLTEVDHRGHEALIAITEHGQEPVAVGRYARVPGDPATAELALAVVDDWQGRGLATVLLQRLAAHARTVGIARLRGVCLAYNREAVDVMTHLGAARARHGDPGLLELELELGVP